MSETGIETCIDEGWVEVLHLNKEELEEMKSMLIQCRVCKKLYVDSENKGGACLFHTGSYEWDPTRALGFGTATAAAVAGGGELCGQAAATAVTWHLQSLVGEGLTAVVEAGVRSQVVAGCAPGVGLIGGAALWQASRNGYRWTCCGKTSLESHCHEDSHIPI
eukprot:Rmarinus@m.16580